MSLPRQAKTGIFEKVIVNVYEIATKTIVFTGSVCDAAKFMGIAAGHCSMAARNRFRVKKKWAVRLAPETQQNN